MSPTTRSISRPLLAQFGKKPSFHYDGCVHFLGQLEPMTSHWVMHTAFSPSPGGWKAKIQASQGHTLSKVSRGGSFPTGLASGSSWVWGRITPVSASMVMRQTSPLCVSPLLPLLRTLATGFGTHLGIPGCSHLEILNCACENPFLIRPQSQVWGIRMWTKLLRGSISSLDATLRAVSLELVAAATPRPGSRQPAENDGIQGHLGTQFWDQPIC